MVLFLFVFYVGMHCKCHISHYDPENFMNKLNIKIQQELTVLLNSESKAWEIIVQHRISKN